jgi:hypothetical protein
MLRIPKVLVACFFLFAVCAQADTILCVGINDYANYPDLKHAENDAEEMGKLFRSRGHDVTVLTGEEVTTRNLQDALGKSPAFVYFAGHGKKDRLVVQDGHLPLAEMGGKGAMILLDCCYVGRSLKTSGSTKILAAAEYEAFESDGHGLFTKYLLNWLKDGKGLNEQALTTYLEKNIAEETGGWQKPVLGYI